MKNRSKASWRSKGSDEAMANTFHLSNPASRKKRSFRRSLGSWVSYDNSSWNHCLTRIPSDAVIRATTRLRNQRMLTRTAYRGLWKDGEVKSGIVELMKFPLRVRLAICIESCTRIWFVRSSGCCCKVLYDSIMNAVTTAENKPACYG